MPNGTVAHFPLRCSELVEMLGEFDANTVIGDVAGDGDSVPKPLTVDSLKQIVQDAVEDQLLVFEQDYGDYVLPFGGGPFVSIGEKSAFYERLHRSHDEFKMKLVLLARQSRKEEKDDSNP